MARKDVIVVIAFVVLLSGAVILFVILRKREEIENESENKKVTYEPENSTLGVTPGNGVDKPIPHVIKGTSGESVKSVPISPIQASKPPIQTFKPPLNPSGNQTTKPPVNPTAKTPTFPLINPPSSLPDPPPPKDTFKDDKKVPAPNLSPVKPPSIFEDALKKVADPKMAVLFQKVIADPALAPELDSYFLVLSATDSWSLKSQAVNSFVSQVNIMYGEYIESLLKANNWDAINMAINYFPTVQKVQGLYTLLGVTSDPDFKAFLARYFLVKCMSILSSGDNVQNVLLSTSTYAKDFFKLASELAAKKVAEFDPLAFPTIYNDTAYGHILAVYRPRLFLHLVKEQKVEFEASMTEAKDLVTKFSLNPPTSKDALEEIPTAYEKDYKLFKGPSMLASKPPRPVGNRRGSDCYAISVLQALASLYPSIEPLVKVDLSVDDDISEFVKIMQALLSDDKSDYEIFTNHKLKNVSGKTGDASVFFKVLLDDFLDNDRGLPFSALFKMFYYSPAKPLPSLLKYFKPGYFSAPTNPPNYFSMGASIVLDNYPLRDNDSDFKEYSEEITVPVLYSLEERKYALAAMVCSLDGHVIAFVKRQGGQWYLVDDTRVHPIKSNQVPSKAESQKKPETLKLPISCTYIRPLLIFYHLVI